MKGFVKNIEILTEKNNYFRRVLYTGPNMQIVIMSLQPKEDIGSEIHKTHDQFFRIESGRGIVYIDNNKYFVKSGDAILIPQGTLHNLKNTGNKPLKFYTIYSPPEHKDKTIHKTKLQSKLN
jgi:mannose-6-phosphate isomerase-like protein (cupin superfamily)